MSYRKFSIRLKQELFEEIDRLSKENNINRTDFISQILAKEIYEINYHKSKLNELEKKHGEKRFDLKKDVFISLRF